MLILNSWVFLVLFSVKASDFLLKQLLFTDAITEFNYEMPLTESVVFNFVILH